MRDDFDNSTVFTNDRGRRVAARHRSTAYLLHALLAVVGLLGASAPISQAFAAGETGSMFCFAGEGQTDKRIYEFISSFGTRIEIELTCVNGAAAVAEMKDHPTLMDILDFEVAMLLRNREKHSKELFSRHPLDGSIEPLMLEQTHELKFGRGPNREVVKVLTELRELELR